MNTYNEEDVINRLQYPETQRAAFGDVVKAYSEQLYWQIRRMVLSHDDANDLLQNTFIKAWSNLNYFRYCPKRKPELSQQATCTESTFD